MIFRVRRVSFCGSQVGGASVVGSRCAVGPGGRVHGVRRSSVVGRARCRGLNMGSLYKFRHGRGAATGRAAGAANFPPGSGSKKCWGIFVLGLSLGGEKIGGP